MKVAHAKRIFFAAVFCFIFTAGLAIAQTDNGKITITTSSKEALNYFLQGRDLGEKLRFQESRDFYRKAVEADTAFALAYLNLAYTVPTVQGFFATFEKALALADRVSEGERLMILAVEAGIGGEATKQIEIYQKLVKAYPNDERAHNRLANSYFEQQDYPASIAGYEKSLAINPDFSQPYNQMGYAYRFQGKYAEAEKAFKKYIELIPDDPNPYDSYAELLMKMGKFEESIVHYQKALDVSPTFYNSHIGIASDYNFMGKHEKAREQLQKLYGMATDNGQRRAALQAKAVSYADEGNMDKAISELKKQLTLAEKDNDAPAMAGDLSLIAYIYLETGQAEKALKFFTKSIDYMEQALVSQDVKENAKRGFLFNSARVALKQNNLPLAKERADKFQKAAEEIRNIFQIRLAHQLAGMIALEEKNYKEAIDQLNQSNLQNPYNWYRLSKAYEGAGDKEKAKDACDRAAHHNTLNSFNYAFIRQNAMEGMTSL